MCYNILAPNLERTISMRQTNRLFGVVCVNFGCNSKTVRFY